MFHTPSSRTAVALFAVLFAGPLAGPARLDAADPPRYNPNPAQSLSAPVVLVVAFDKYPKLRDLKYPVANGIAFAKAMAGQGYRITFVTGKESLKTAKDKLTDVTKDVRPVDDAEGLEKVWRAWMEDHFLDRKAATQAPFGFVSFGGHGEKRSPDVRDRDTYFLTPADEKGEGGMSIQEMQRYCALRNLPVVMMMDMCRAVVPEKAPADPPPGKAKSGPAPSATTLLVLRNRGNRFGFSEERGTPLTIWSARIGEEAGDVEEDMTAILTKGLKVVVEAGSGRTFAAGAIFATAPGGEAKTDLSLRTWFQYGIAQGSDSPMAFEIDRGNVEQQQVFASTVQGRLRQLFAADRPAINLMDEWKFGAGSFAATNTPLGIEIARPEGVAKDFFSTGVVALAPESAKRTLVLECTALVEGVPPGGKATLPVLVQPHTADGRRYLYTGWNKTPIDVPYNELRTFRIPLDNSARGAQMARLAFSAIPKRENEWPADAKLLVTRMRLCPSAGAEPVAPPAAKPDPLAPIDLSGRWWLCDVLRRESSKAKMFAALKAGKAGAPAWHLAAKDAEKGEPFGRGGAVFPSVFADKAVHELRIQLAGDRPTRKTKFEIALFGKDTVLAEKSVEIPPAKWADPILVKLKESDRLDYIGITTDDPEFRATIAGMWLVAKPAGSR